MVDHVCPVETWSGNKAWEEQRVQDQKEGGASHENNCSLTQKLIDLKEVTTHSE